MNKLSCRFARSVVSSSLAGFGFLLPAGSAWSAAVAMPYGGSYDERTQAPGSDYNGLGGFADVGEFTLRAGNKFFLGGVRAPGDPSDVFLDRRAPVLHTAPAFERGPGSYGVLLGNGTFAMNNNGLMAYRMNFSVFDTTPPTVSEPLSTLLVGVALGLLLATRRPAIVPVPASAYAARRRGYAILGGHWCVSAWQALHQAYSAS